MKKIIFILLLGFGWLGSVEAATLTVTRADDPTPDGCKADDCSLREAIIDSNASAGVTDTIIFSATTATTYQLQLAGANESAAATGDLDITDSVNVQGQIVNNSIMTTIDGGALDRIFQVFSGVKVQISGIIIQNGDARTNTSPFVTGGGIVNFGDLTLTNVIVKNNIAEQGGGIANYGSSLKVINSTLNNNTAKKTANAGSGNGGGVEQSKFGSGTFNLSITNSTLSANTAENSGGGIRYDNGTVNLNNATIFGNIAPTGSGGGISTDNSTSVNVRNSMIAGSKNSTGVATADCAGTLTSQGFDWVQDQTDCSISGAQSGDPKLDSNLLANNGPTPTHALLSASGAIDAGDSAGCKDETGAALTTDQRGTTRPLNGKGDGQAPRCDIGAFELNLCGNGKVDTGEQCDDGNLTAGDGCSATCQKEDLDGDKHFPLSVGGDDCDDNDATVFSGATEICDGKDNNCDGKIDENLGQTTCGVGTCQVTVDNCANGKTQTCTPKPAGVEICDGLDNNCDGKVDETFTDLGTSCTVGTGACAGTGKMICATDGSKTVCDTSASNPGTETCNGIDDDCNGSIDDGLGTTTCGNGLCQVTVDNCKNGQTQTCNPDLTKKTTEICGDGIDQDCDGQDATCPPADNTTSSGTATTTDATNSNSSSGGCSLIPGS